MNERCERCRCDDVSGDGYDACDDETTTIAAMNLVVCYGETMMQAALDHNVSDDEA